MMQGGLSSVKVVAGFDDLVTTNTAEKDKKLATHICEVLPSGRNSCLLMETFIRASELERLFVLSRTQTRGSSFGPQLLMLAQSRSRLRN